MATSKPKKRPNWIEDRWAGVFERMRALAVFLRDMTDRADEMKRLADLATDVLYDMGGLIHALPYRDGAHNEQTPLMNEIRTQHQPMKPEAAAFLAKAQRLLDRAPALLQQGFADDAGPRGLPYGAAGRSATDRDGAARTDPADEHREPALGCAPHPRRTTQARV
jgi:hypothetical protein